MLNIGGNENSEGSEADPLWPKTRKHIVQIVSIAYVNYESVGKTTPILRWSTSEVHVLMVFSFSNTYNRDTIAVQRFYWAFLMTLQLICGQLDAFALSFSLAFQYFLATQSMINLQGSSKYWDLYHNSWSKGAKTEISTSISIHKQGNFSSKLLMSFSFRLASILNYLESTSRTFLHWTI